MESRQELTVHPAAEILPPMSEAEYSRLKDDIKLNGQREAIWIYGGQILDGRNRYRACNELGIEPKTQQYSGDDLEQFVLGVNLHRRHLNPSQLAIVAAKLANQSWGGDRSKAQNCALSRERAAEKCNVSERMIDDAAALLKGAKTGKVTPELLEIIELGKMRLAKAHEIAKLPIEKQRNIAAQIRDGKVVSRLSKYREAEFERMADKVQRMAAQLARLTGSANSVKKVTTKSSKRLADACRAAARVLDESADRLAPTLDGATSPRLKIE